MSLNIPWLALTPMAPSKNGIASGEQYGTQSGDADNGLVRSFIASCQNRDMWWLHRWCTAMQQLERPKNNQISAI
jgi:hypothetical protein